MVERIHSTAALPKRARGRTTIGDTPVSTRSRVPLQEAARRSIEQRLRRVLAPFGPRIERASIRFEDLNGPRGGEDLRCAIKVVFSGSDSVIVEERGAGVLEVVRRVIPRVGRIVRRHVDASGRKTPRATRASLSARRGRPLEAPKQDVEADSGTLDGGLIGKRIARRSRGLPRALERPEKARRDALVDTAARATSETDRKAGGARTARRNSKQNTSGMTYALEDSLWQPTRKSTRGSGNRIKAATQLSRRAQRKVSSPSARATRERPV
jgi:hypothetical protein